MKKLLLSCLLLGGCSALNNEFHHRHDPKVIQLVDFKKPVYETEDKKVLWYVGGNIYQDRDQFHKIEMLTGFTHLGLEY